MENQIYVRWMIRRDIPEVLAIERASFDDPWTEEDFIAELRQRNHVGIVAERDEKVVGFMVYVLCSDSFDIINFAVDGECWRQGVGTRMVEKLRSKMVNQDRSQATVAIREGNLAAQMFFHNHEFEAVEILRRYYGEQDAYLMLYDKKKARKMDANNRITQLQENE